MPLFYFDVYDGLSGLDCVGRECADHNGARVEATMRANRLLVDSADWFGTGQKWQIGVVDAAGRFVFILDFRHSPDAGSASRPAAPRRSKNVSGVPRVALPGKQAG